MSQPYNSTDTATAWKNSHFILLEWSDFHSVVNLLIAGHAYVDIAFSRWDIVTEVREIDE